MMALMGLFGLLACGVGGGVVIGVSVVTSIITVGVSIDNANKQKEATEDAANQAREAQKKNEAAQAAAHLRQKRQIAKNLATTQKELGSAIMYERLLTEKGKRSLTKERAEMAKHANSDLPSTHMKDSFKGNPSTN